MKEKRIAIIGGGVAGLACAIGLVNNGFRRVVVFERDKDFAERRQGYGLTILQGISALRKLGLYSQVEQLDTPSRSHYIFDSRGSIVGFYGTAFWPDDDDENNDSKKKKKKHNLHISRQNLRRLLREKYQSVSESDIVWNKRFSGIKSSTNDHEMVVCFTDGTEHTADLVIGCDGVNSRVRRFKYDEKSDHELNYLGIIVVLGITHSDHPLASERVFQTVDGVTRLFAMPFADNHDTSSDLNIMWQLSFPLDESDAKRLSANGAELKEEVLRRCGQWHEPIPSMIKSTDLNLLMGVVAYDRNPSPPPLNQSNRNIVLLGDSAHPMSPFKGQGANQALLDAVNLVSRLAEAQDDNDDGLLERVIHEFDQEMYKRVRDKVELSRERATTYHDPSIVRVENFTYRGVDEQLIETLREKGINSESGHLLEQLIMNEMNSQKIV